MSSVIIVDQELAESVKGYAELLKGSSPEGSTFVADFCKHLNAAQSGVVDKEGLKEAVYKATTVENLTRFNDKDFEPTFNLAIYLLGELYGGLEELLTAKPEFLKIVVDCAPVEQPSLRDRKSIKSTTILSILNTIFNLLPKTSKLRIPVIESILQVVEQSHLEFSLIQSSMGPYLIDWLKASQTSEKDLKSIFWKFIALDTKVDLKTLTLIKDFTKEFTIDNVEQARQLAKSALQSEVVDVSFIVTSNVAKCFNEFGSQDELISTFASYAQGKLVSKAPEPLDSNIILAKSKILALSKFFSTSDKSEFAYADIPTELASNNIELETLLVNAIKSGVIEGKLNQIKETFYLTRSNSVVVAGADNSSVWSAVEEVLQQWKASLNNIHEVVNTARENIVNTQG